MSDATKKKREWRKADGSKLPPASEPLSQRGSDQLQADLFGNGPNAADLLNARDRGGEFSLFAPEENSADLTAAERAMRFMHRLSIPEGPNAGKPVKLAPFQRQFIEGAMAPDVSNAILSIGRGNAKTALTAGIALGGLLGVWDRQPRREIVVAARTRDQGKIAWDFAAGFAAGMSCA
ncbi:hypothetical protein ACSSNL_11135 [Thalassobius sp. S69A]|uniref:hypothetical protein n=1 Tax=unclassified Thalassovita TaxID=2619711 RepID=UPI003C7E7C8B